MSVLVHKNNCMRALVHMHDQVTSLTWLHVRFIFIHLFYPYLYLFLPDIPIRLQLLISHWLICWPWQKIAWWSQASICRSGILLLSPSWGPPYLISKFSRAWEGFRSSQQAQALYAAWLVDLNWPGPRHVVICSVGSISISCFFVASRCWWDTCAKTWHEKSLSFLLSGKIMSGNSATFDHTSVTSAEGL